MASTILGPSECEEQCKQIVRGILCWFLGRKEYFHSFDLIEVCFVINRFFTITVKKDTGEGEKGITLFLANDANAGICS